MRLLESSLEKISSLLRVGFGEAGAGIVRSNLTMQGTNKSTYALHLDTVTERVCS